MRQINFFKCAFISIFFILAVACEKEGSNDESIPTKVQTEFASRFPNANILDYTKYVEPRSSDKIWEIEFTNESGAKTKAWYLEDGTWKMTQTELKTIDDLTAEAKDAFTSSIHGSTKTENIYKTERDKIQGSLYTLELESTSKASDKKTSFVFINDDGLFINNYTWSEYDGRSIVNLPEKQFKFINDTYKDAEIRGYINNSGLHEYFILHEDKIKFVTFKITSGLSVWAETRYEIDINTVLPDNVIKYLNRIDPDFVYTNIYYIETNEVDKYYLVDNNDPKGLGHYVSVDI